MKHKITSILLSATIASAMLMNSPVATLKAAAAKPQYISDVFIAYGDTEEEARQWLIDNGWEPVKGDFNSGKKDKTSGFANVAAVMGIKRTSDPKNAITDMAVMNMNGGYSFNDYKQLLAEKKGEIDEFIYSFIPVLREYRANYNGNGSNGGQKRAKYAHDILNKFFDGEVDGKYAIHDTGKLLGDGLLDLVEIQVFFGEDKETELMEIAVEAVVHLVHLDLEDTFQGQSQRPEFVLVATDDGTIAQAIGITALVDMAHVLGVHLLHSLPRHLVHQGIGHVLVLAYGTGHLDAKTLSFILQVGTIAVDQMGVMLAQQCGQRDHGITLKETGIELRFKHRYVGFISSVRPCLPNHFLL